MEYTINSTKWAELTKAQKDAITFRFIASGKGGYIKVSIDGDQYRQICRGGKHFGSAITCPEDSEEALKKVARRWYGDYVNSSILMD